MIARRPGCRCSGWSVLAAFRAPFIVLLLFYTSAFIAAADTPSDRGVEASLWPNVIELSVAPGQSAERSLRLDYVAGLPAEAVVQRSDYLVDADGKRRLFAIDSADGFTRPPELERWAGASWISTSTEPGVMLPGDSRQINLRVTVPDDAEPGEHRAYLFISLEPTADKGAIMLVPSFGVQVYVFVPGAEVRRVESLQVRPEYEGSLPLGNPVRLTASLRNAGTVSLRGGGEVVVERWTGGEVARLPLPDERIIPGERARLGTTWAGPPQWELFGRYYARFEFADDTLALASPPVEGFWLINWTSVGAVLVVVLGAWLLRLNRVLRASLRGLRAGARAFRAGLREP